MAIASTRSVIIGYSGDVQGLNELESSVGAIGEIDSIPLTTGANTITCPSSCRGVTIVPPAANTVVLTLKGIAADTGILLHLTDPTSIAIASGQASFVINAASNVTLRFFWT